MIVTLNMLALVLQIAGSLVLGWEVWEAQRRWTREFVDPNPRILHASLSIPRVRGSLYLEHPVRDDHDVSERLRLLEKGRDEDAENMRGYVHEAVAASVEETNEALDRVQGVLTTQVMNVVHYLAGQGQRRWWMPWWLGPVLLLAGTILGGIAGLATLATA